MPQASSTDNSRRFFTLKTAARSIPGKISTAAWKSLVLNGQKNGKPIGCLVSTTSRSSSRWVRPAPASSGHASESLSRRDDLPRVEERGRRVVVERRESEDFHAAHSIPAGAE